MRATIEPRSRGWATAVAILVLGTGISAPAATPPLPDELELGSITSVKSAQEAAPYHRGMNREVTFELGCAMAPPPHQLAVYRFDQPGGLPGLAEMQQVAGRVGMGPGGIEAPGPTGSVRLVKAGYEILFWAAGEFRFEDLGARDDSGLPLPAEVDAQAFAEGWLSAAGFRDPAHELTAVRYGTSGSRGQVRMTLSYLRRLPSGFLTRASGVELTLVAAPGGPRVRVFHNSGSGLDAYKWASILPLEAALSRIRQGNCMFQVRNGFTLPPSVVIDRCRLEYSHQADRYIEPLYVLEGTSTDGPFTVLVSAVEGKYLEPELNANVEFHPRTLNLRSQGRWVTVHLELPATIDGQPVHLGEIDPGSILLADRVSPEARPRDIGDDDRDGVPELKLKFDRAAVQEALGLDGTDRAVTVVVSGSIRDRVFQGSDTIRIIH